MVGLSVDEQACVERAMAAQEAMLRRTLEWASINSGSRNLAGLAAVGERIAGALAALPGEVAWVEPAPVTSVGADGVERPLEHGRHLRSIRPITRSRPAARSSRG